jgi:hypothetical protein
MTTRKKKKTQFVLNPLEFTHKHLKGKLISELKFICKQLDIAFIVKNKKKNIASIIKYSKQHSFNNIDKKCCSLNDDDILLAVSIEKTSTFSDSFDETWD